jgi:ABC-type multidrug transport system permease subunit
MILIIIRSIWRDDYPRHLGFVLEILSTIMMLVVFWYTSLAFKPQLDNGVSYFDYLLMGEVILYLPLLLLQHNVRLGKKMARRGTFDFFFVNKVNILNYFFYYSLAYLIKDFIRLLLLILLSAFLFSFPIGLLQLALLLSYIVVISFFTMLIGIAVGLSLIFWGRGEGSFGQFISLLTILGGAYFPLSVFPQWLQKLSLSFNPLTGFLEYGRDLTRGLWQTPPLAIFIWPFVILLFYKFIYSYGLKYYRNNGPPTDITF